MFVAGVSSLTEFGSGAPTASGPFEVCQQLSLGQLRGGARGRGGGQDGARLRAHDAIALVGEGRQHRRVVLPQHRAEFVLRAGAVPHGVLLGAGEHRNCLGQFGVGRQWPVRGHVGAQDVR